MNMKNKLFQDKLLRTNFIYNSAYQILSMIIPLITTPYISRVLGAEGVGRFSFSKSVAYYFVLFSMLGVNKYGNRSIAQVRDNKKERSKTFWGIYTLQLTVSLISFLAYMVYAICFSNDITISLIMALYVLSAGIDINWAFFGLEQFKTTTIRNTVVKLMTILSIFAFVKTRKDVYIYCLIFSLGTLLSQVILWTRLKNFISFSRICIHDITKHIKPNIVLFIPVIAVSLYKIMDKVMLGLLSTSTETGYYESSELLLQVPVALITSLGTIMLPRISNLIAVGQKEEGNAYLYQSIQLALIISSSMSLGIVAVSKEFVPLFYGPGFERCISLYWILMPSCIFVGVANVIRTQILIPYQKDSVYIITIFIGAVMNLVINGLFIPKLGSIGAAIGTLVAEAAVCVGQLYAIRKEIDIRRVITNFGIFTLIGAIMCIVVWNINLTSFSTLIHLTVKVLLGAIIYIVLLASFLFSKKMRSNSRNNADNSH